MSGVAAVGREAARQQRRRARAPPPVRSGIDAVHAAAAELRRAAAPRRRQHDAEVDRPRRRARVDGIDRRRRRGNRRARSPSPRSTPARASVTRRTGSPIRSIGIVVPIFSATQSAALMVTSSAGANGRGNAWAQEPALRQSRARPPRRQGRHCRPSQEHRSPCGSQHECSSRSRTEVCRVAYYARCIAKIGTSGRPTTRRISSYCDFGVGLPGRRRRNFGAERSASNVGSTPSE